MSTNKTGWEALDKWVGSDGSSGDAAAASAPTGTTGWEALDKWVSDSGSPTNAGSAAGGGSSAGGGFFGWLKRLFGGK